MLEPMGKSGESNNRQTLIEAWVMGEWGITFLIPHHSPVKKWGNGGLSLDTPNTPHSQNPTTHRRREIDTAAPIHALLRRQRPRAS
jgi:hypothetical protein